MRENKYDDEKSFEKYSRFSRSVDELNGAGEWHELKKMLPDFKDKRVIDIGCGFGWHCIYAAEHGATYVLGTDISEKMLCVAKEKTKFPNVEYECVAMEDLSVARNSFDVVISSLVFHYTADFESICNRIHDCLVADGDFVFSVEHPVFTAYGTQDWHYDDGDTRAHWPVDHYFIQGKRDAIFLGEPVTKYHRTLTTYLNTLLLSGFTITGIMEPQPPEELLQSIPEMHDELRRPMMLLVSAKKVS